MEISIIDRSKFLNNVANHLVNADKFFNQSLRKDGTVDTKCQAFSEHNKHQKMANLYVRICGFTNEEVNEVKWELMGL